MSRYVDLDGVTWDGTPISSKVQEVETKHGYVLGITIGWLWEDSVPHINLEEHDSKVRAGAIEEFKKNLINEFCCYCNQEPCEGGMNGSVQECETARTIRDAVYGIAEQMKGAQNETL